MTVLKDFLLALLHGLQNVVLRLEQLQTDPLLSDPLQAILDVIRQFEQVVPHLDLRLFDLLQCIFFQMVLT